MILLAGETTSVEAPPALAITVISVLGLLLAGVLVESMRSRHQTIQVINEMRESMTGVLYEMRDSMTEIDKRLIAVETTIQYFHPPPYREQEK